MFCDACGTTLHEGQQFCSQCGKQVTGLVSHVGYPQRGRVQEHVRLVAILWLAFAAFEALGGVVVYILAHTLFPHLVESEGAPAFLVPLMTFVSIFVLGKALVGFVAGWGLLQREPWARTVALVLAFIALLHPPLGTALGVYTLWVLLPATSEQEYDRQVAGAHAA